MSEIFFLIIVHLGVLFPILPGDILSPLGKIFYSPEKQNGGYQTGNSYNSAKTPPRNEISAAIPMFSGAAYTLEYLSTRISLPLYQKPRWRLPNRKQL